MTTDVAGTAGYDTQADILADQYESVDFATVHRDVLHLIPARPCRCIDVGAGSGRDAAALAARGHAVVAVEPSAALRREGQRRHAAAAITWLDDSLPELAAVGRRGERFDVILLSAVWMHLDEPERRVAMASIAALLEPAGIAILSLRHGPVPAGRRMFSVTADETVALAASYGLACRHCGTRRDPHVRDGVTWSVLVFGRGAQ
jgi:2-polyprenyl-3-methyl-5-hydroxy-6-metoxy-1,4-benzoquinol methylase